MKQLLTKFRGDEIWAPCGYLQTENDVTLFGPIHTATTEQSVSVHDGIEEPVPVEQGSISIPTLQHGDSVSQASVPDKLDIPLRYSPQPLTGSAAITNERRLREEIKGLRARRQSPDPVQSALSALISGDADKGMNTLQNAMHDYGNRSTDLHGKTAEDEILAAEQSNVTGEVSRDDDMGESLNAENVMLEDEDAPTTAPVSSESVDLSVQNPPIKEPPDSNSNDERKCEEAVPSPVEIAGRIVQSTQLHVESAMDGNGIADNRPERADPKHPDEPRAEGKEREQDGEILQPAQHRMTTRAQAQVASDNATTAPTRSPSPASSISTFVHPLFLVPASAHPDRDFGLPSAEAEDTRRVLMSYVQKQEEVCRGVGKLYEGLLRADRMRKTVLQWCKAEEHVGEMSDGEDWYDKEEWALDEDLKKGHDEEDDEGGNQGKKTRGRRA